MTDHIAVFNILHQIFLQYQFHLTKESPRNNKHYNYKVKNKKYGHQVQSPWGGSNVLVFVFGKVIYITPVQLARDEKMNVI